MIAGSNPNADVETRKYRTEYQVEYISPPYMSKPRPTYTGLPAKWNYGQQITISITLPLSLNPSVNPPVIAASLMDLGFSTHGVHSACLPFLSVDLADWCVCSGYEDGQAPVHALFQPQESDDHRPAQRVQYVLVLT
jgi:hypothetical protein